VKYDYTKAKFFDTGISMISKYDPYEDRILFGHGLGIGFIDSNEKIEAFTDSTGETLTFYPSALEFTSNGNVWIGEPFWFGAFRQGEQATEARVEVALRRLPKPTGDFDDERQ